MPGALMSLNFLPVARRELLVMSKRRSTHWLRTIAALATAAIGFSVIVPGVLHGSLPTEIGALLFYTLTGLALGISLLAGPLLAADCLSEERRQGTLGLLFLGTLRSHDIVAGKLVSLGLPALYCLLAVFPVLGISFFLGGVAAGEFLRAALSLLTVQVFSLATAVFVSAFSRSSRRALGGTVLLLLICCAAPPLLDWKPLVDGNPSAASLVSLSPAAGFVFAYDALHAVNASAYWNSITFTLLASVLWLVLSCIWLPHSWQDRVSVPERQSGRGIRPSQQNHRQAERACILARDPALWLASRDQSGRLGLWTPAICFALVAAWCLVNPDPSSVAAGLVMTCVLVSHGLYKLWIASEASRGFIADRRSGELELLLSTPLESRQIWRSHLVRLKRRFIGPAIVILGGDALLLVFGLRQDAWLDTNPEFILPLIAIGVVFVIDSYTAAWVGLWQSLAARSATRATLRTVTFTFLLPGGGFLLLLGTLAVLSSSPVEAMLWLVTGWFVTGCATDIGLCGWTMARVSDSFREAATRPMGTRGGGL